MSFLPGTDEEVENPNAQLAVDESGYIPPDVEVDQSEIAEQVFDNLAERVPGWEANDGNLETWLIEAWAEVASEIRALARDVPASIFLTYSQDVLGITPGLEVPATGTATFTALDTAGYTLEAGIQFTLARSGDDLVAFEVTQQVSIDPGAQSVDADVNAVVPGADGNGLSGAGEMLDPVTWVQSVTVTEPTAEGADAELPEDFLDRLSVLMRMIALRPVLPQDFAILALQVTGVARAISMNLYDPVADTWDNERTVTVVLADVDGEPVSAEIKQEVTDYLESLREVNWVVHIIDPTYTDISVTYEVVAFAGQNAPTVQDACDAALTDYLSPANYRLNELSPATDGGEVIFPPTDATTRAQYIYVNELIALLDRTMGVDRVVSVTINGAAADYLMPDPYTFPRPGTLSGTVDGAQA
jgi:hypothetical protein